MFFGSFKGIIWCIFQMLWNEKVHSNVTKGAYLGREWNCSLDIPNALVIPEMLLKRSDCTYGYINNVQTSQTLLWCHTNVRMRLSYSEILLKHSKRACDAKKKVYNMLIIDKIGCQLFQTCYLRRQLTRFWDTTLVTGGLCLVHIRG